MKPVQALSSVAVLIVLLVGLIFGPWFAIKAMTRHQKIADTKNNAHAARIQADNEALVNELRIKAQAQKVKIATQDAEIRRQTALGIRAAQDEIAKTLTPLYVQFEMVEALKEIAKSGHNSSVVFIPSGPAGIPLIAGADGKPVVGGAPR